MSKYSKLIILHAIALVLLSGAMCVSASNNQQGVAGGGAAGFMPDNQILFYEEFAEQHAREFIVSLHDFRDFDRPATIVPEVFDRLRALQQEGGLNQEGVYIFLNKALGSIGGVDPVAFYRKIMLSLGHF